MMYWNGHMTAAGWIVAIIWTAIIFALIAGAIYWLVTTLAGRAPGAGTAGAVEGSSAREILDRRLARGELTVEQYRELRATMSGGDPTAGGNPTAGNDPTAGGDSTAGGP